jgi:hypothetical protein
MDYIEYPIYAAVVIGLVWFVVKRKSSGFSRSAADGA